MRQKGEMNWEVKLNGLWDFVVDLDPKYHEARNYARSDWDRRHWAKVPVPGVWNKYGERYDLYEGVGWFAREFSLPALPSGATCWLRLGGVNYLCEVYVNGQLAGTHEGGYTEFSLEVSSLVQEGRNVVAVRVDNRSLNMKLPPVLGYFNYGGIHRDMTLEVYPWAYLSDLGYEARPVDGGGWLRVGGTAAGPGAGECQVRASCSGVTAKVPVGADGRFTLEMEIPGARPWSPDAPVLHALEVSLWRSGEATYRRELEIGFRTLAIEGTRLQLNGAPLDLRGICYLYDSPTYGLVLRPEQYQGDLELLKELGVNALRSHWPFPHDFLTACDRAGIMVWVEVPVYCIDTRMASCRTAFQDADWQALALSMVEEMIQQSKLHPSVVIYGIGNECQLDAPGASAFLGRLAGRAKEIDATRPVSYACLYGLAGDIAEVVDIVGFNEYWGWYDILPREQLTSAEPAPSSARPVDLRKLEAMLRQQAATYGKPVFLTEFGADSVPGYRSGSLDLWSEDYHAQVIRETLALAEQFPFVCGTFPFVFADYRDPSKEINGYWDEMNYKGVVTYERRKKRPFYALQEAYRRRRGR